MEPNARTVLQLLGHDPVALVQAHPASSHLHALGGVAIDRAANPRRELDQALSAQHPADAALCVIALSEAECDTATATLDRSLRDSADPLHPSVMVRLRAAVHSAVVEAVQAAGLHTLWATALPDPGDPAATRAAELGARAALHLLDLTPIASFHELVIEGVYAALEQLLASMQLGLLDELPAAQALAREATARLVLEYKRRRQLRAEYELLPTEHLPSLVEALRRSPY